MAYWHRKYTFPNGLILPNRFVFAPISTMSSSQAGLLTKEELDFYKKRAASPGLFILGSANVSHSGKAYEGNVSIAHEAAVPSLRIYNQQIKSKGAKSIVQIYHGGSSVRFLPSQKEVFTVSNLPEFGKDQTKEYRQLIDKEIQQIIADFGKAVSRAIRAGFDGVEIHAGNPFLVQQFLSPKSNLRNDFWGGTFRKRLRFLEAILRSALCIREKESSAPFIVGVRLALEESEPGGLTFQGTCRIVAELSKIGIDFIHFHQQNYAEKEDGKYRLQLLQEQLKRPVALIGNGGIRSEEDLQQALDFVPLASAARALILQPYFPFSRTLPQSFTEAKENNQQFPEGLEESILASPDWYFYEE